MSAEWVFLPIVEINNRWDVNLDVLFLGTLSLCSGCI